MLDTPKLVFLDQRLVAKPGVTLNRQVPFTGREITEDAVAAFLRGRLGLFEVSGSVEDSKDEL